MVRVVELDAVAVDEADCCVGMGCRDQEFFQEISPNLKICVRLEFGLVFPRLCRHPFSNLTVGAARSQLVMHLPRLPTRFGRLVHRPLPRASRFWG